MIYKGVLSAILATVLVCVFNYDCAFAQVQIKRVIDFSTYKKWPFIQGIDLSKDGKYILFHVDDDEKERTEFVIKSINNKREWKYRDLRAAVFTSDSKYALLSKADGDTVYLDLEHDKEKKDIIQQKESEPVRFEMDIHWNPAHTGITINRNGQVNAVENVTDYLTSIDQRSLVLTCKEERTGSYALYRYNLEDKKQNLLFKSKLGEKIELDHSNRGHVLFNVILPFNSVNAKFTSVDVWGYKDASAPMPFAERKRELKRSQYLINAETEKIVQLGGLNERVLGVKGDYALVEYRLGEPSFEFNWNEKSRASYYLVSLKDSTRKLIHQQNSKGMMEAKLSPDGNYVVFSDYGLLKYQAYDIKVGVLVDLCHNIEISATAIDIKFKYPSSDFYWLKDHALVVKDDYDLWKLDLTGKNPPLNLTGGYGKKYNITFWINKTLHPRSFFGDFCLQENELKGYLLNAFDHKDKSWGFYKLTNLTGKGLQKLSLGAYYYGGEDPGIIKAEQGTTFLLTRATTKEFPNLFVTHDFKSFVQLSDVQPQKTYNWMSSELLRWKTSNGEFKDGILYKPENFDPSRKYPVVVHIYNEFTSGLNKYKGVQQDVNTLDITWLVSNGYLVFIPDLIHREPGRPFNATYDMLIPGVNYLAGLPFVDAGKIGLQGASWGGGQVNYMVTHSKLFAAAYSGAGYSEQISGSGFMDKFVSGGGKFGQNELHFRGLLTSIPSVYTEESALFSADKLETPLLIKSNIDDDAVPFYQGLQFFTLLRRLGKKVWMLQYDIGGHGIKPGKDCEDMNLRISQFFDHYLKGKPAPKWMTQGISPEYKQIDSGLELDAPGVIP